MYFPHFSESGTTDAPEVKTSFLEVDMLLAVLERLIGLREEKLSSVLLRQNPNNIAYWLRRAQIFKEKVWGKKSYYLELFGLKNYFFALKHYSDVQILNLNFDLSFIF